MAKRIKTNELNRNKSQTSGRTKMAKKIKKKYKAPTAVKKAVKDVVDADKFKAGSGVKKAVKSVSKAAKKAKGLTASPDAPIQVKTKGLVGQGIPRGKLAKLSDNSDLSGKTINSKKEKLRVIRAAYKKSPTQANRNKLQEALKNFDK